MNKQNFTSSLFLLVTFTTLFIFNSCSTYKIKNKETGSRYFPFPEIIKFDNKSLILNGERKFIYSGAFHYFRCPKELWKERFQTIKDAGFNTVETYIPWNRHEKNKPRNLNDYSEIDLTEFHEWLEMADSFGFYVIVRPGPFICAEYDRGGYPGWLITLKPENPKRWMWLRSDDPVYLDWSTHWMKAFCQSIVKYQVTRKKSKKGIILLQIENEFSHVYFPTDAKIDVMRSLVSVCVENGIEIPLIACESPEISESGDPLLKKYTFETRNFYPYYNVKGIKNNLDKLRKAQPDAPLMTTELQGGWFPFIWKPQTFEIGKDYYPDTYPPEQIQNLTMYCIQNGQTILNYYMLFGGTNYNNTESKDMQTSYDYGAPIREHGGTGEKYRRIKAIGEMLRKHGDDLATSTLDTSLIVISDNADVSGAVRVDKKGNKYIFIRNDNRYNSYKGVLRVGEYLNIKYDLGKFDSKMLFIPSKEKKIESKTWYPQLEEKNTKSDIRPEKITINQIEEIAEPLPITWIEAKLGESLLDWGVYDNRYVYYKATFNLDKSQIAQNLILRVSYPYIKAGTLHSKDNGIPDDVLVMHKENNLVLKKGNYPGDFIIPDNLLKEGVNEFVLLYENAGYTKEFVYMEKRAGISNIRLLPSSIDDLNLIEWKFRQSDRNVSKYKLQEITNPGNFTWTTVRLEKEDPTYVGKDKRGVFFKNITFSKEQILNGKTAIHFSQLGDISTIYVNGQEVGKSISRVHPITIDLSAVVKTGNNKIIIITDNYDMYVDGGIGLARITYPENTGIKPDSFQYLPANDKPSFSSNENTKSLIKWIKISFSIAKNDKFWVPYYMTLTTKTNGRIILNGNPIGRCWTNSKQQNYYLPECWLNFGFDKKNEIILQLKNSNEKLIESVSFASDPTFAIKK